MGRHQVPCCHSSATACTHITGYINFIFKCVLINWHEQNPEKSSDLLQEELFALGRGEGIAVHPEHIYMVEPGIRGH